MDNTAPTPFRLRDYRPDTDIPALVALFNLEYPDEPMTVEQEEHDERSYPAGNPRLRFAVETDGGRFIGFGVCMFPFWMEAPGVYQIYGIVDPAWRGRGIGQALLAELEPYARGQGAERLWTDCRESQAHSIRFLEGTGFTIYGIRFEQTLDLKQFDAAAWATAFERVAGAGYTLTTLARMRTAQPEADRNLFELYRAAVGDVPFPGGARLTPEYDTWRSDMLDGPANEPEFIFVALDGKRMIGMTSIMLPKEGPAVTSSTVVLREYRGRGIALALKVMSLAALQKRSYAEARTQNDTANPPILHLNERLGYRRLPGWLQWEKRLQDQ